MFMFISFLKTNYTNFDLKNFYLKIFIQRKEKLSYYIKNPM